MKINKIRFEKSLTYIGETKDLIPHGKGRLVYIDRGWSTIQKRICIGEWKNGIKNGRFYFAYNNMKNMGEWFGIVKKDKLVKGMRIIKFSGYNYIGEYKNDEPNGKGFIKYFNNTKYEGEIKDGSQNGVGIKYEKEKQHPEGGKREMLLYKGVFEGNECVKYISRLNKYKFKWKLNKEIINIKKFKKDFKIFFSKKQIKCVKTIKDFNETDKLGQLNMKIFDGLWSKPNSIFF